MHTKAILACLTVILSTPAMAGSTTGSTEVAATEPSPESAPGPRAFLPSPHADLGTVMRGPVVEHEFVIENRGDAPLELLGASSDLQLVEATFDPVVKPGGQGRVRVRIDTWNLVGPVQGAVTVGTNEPDRESLVLSFSIATDSPLAVEPGTGRWSVVQGELAGSIIPQQIWTLDGSDFNVTEVEVPAPFVATVRAPTDDEAKPGTEGNQYTVELSVSVDAPAGFHSGFATIHTDHPRQPDARIPLTALVRPIFVATPEKADFGNISLEEPLTKKFAIKNFATETITIATVTTDLEGVEAAIEPVQEGRIYFIALTLPTDLPKGAFSGTVTLQTESEKIPEFRVPFLGVVE